jgi:uncharacterized metal-binding protein YceD (DUF177 family)
MEKFQIQFSGLKPGLHLFDLNLDCQFFEFFGYSEFSKCDIRVNTEMEKEEHLMVFRFRISGDVELLCDRCGDPLTEHLDGHERLVVKLGDHNGEESEEVLLIKESDGKFDISQILYEYVSLMVPSHRIHGDDENGNSLCNPEMLKKLDELKEHHEPDPRWEVLNRLRENNLS